MVLAAATQILLSRWSGQDDIAVGTAVAGRDRAELEHIIGFFVNTIVLRATIDSRRTFTGFLSQVRTPPWTPSPTSTSRSNASSTPSSPTATPAAPPCSRP